MMPTIGERACITCGQPFPIPANNPHRRFCSPRCRVADWHARHDQQPSRHANAVPNAVADPNHAADDLPRANAVPTADGVQRCPHCHAPLAVIAVVVPPTAAHVRIPEPTHA
jgi:endogenous inhibitor of DNA gyrase (YacG/DUF329 family)